MPIEQLGALSGRGIDNGASDKAFGDGCFDVLILAFLNFGNDTNDTPVLARLIKDQLPERVGGARLRTRIRKVAVNQRAVGKNIQKAMALEARGKADMVLGLGVDANINQSLVRFEGVADVIPEQQDQYSRRGRVMPERSTRAHHVPQAQQIAHWVQSPALVALARQYSTAFSTDAGGYLCEYMLARLNQAERISDKPFFIHVGHLQGLQDASTLGARSAEMHKIIGFIQAYLKYRLEESS